MSAIEGKTIVVWFSCGAASAVAAKKTIERYGASNTVRVVNNPIADEDDDNRRFLANVEKWLGVKIESAINPKYPECSIEVVWMKKKFMSSPKGAPCTAELKKAARQEWEKRNQYDYLVMGFTADEKKRFVNFVRSERENTLPVLIDEGITKEECFHILSVAGIKIPGSYARGYPNANCPGCVKASSPTYWNFVREVDPVVFAKRAALSRLIGARLVRYKGKRIFLDELPRDAKGRPMKSLKAVECGIFCEEKIA
jgi:hypothetical protein